MADAEKKPQPAGYKFRSRRMTGKGGEREQQIRMIQTLGYAVFTLLIGVNVFSEPLREKWLSGDIVGLITKVFLIVVVICLVFLWFESSTREFDYINEWASIDHTAPPTAVHEALMVTMIALFLAGLFYTILWPLYFAILFTLYTLMDIGVQKYAQHNIRSVLKVSKSEVEADIELAKGRRDEVRQAILGLHLDAINALSHYYRHEFQGLRRLCIFVASIYLLALSLIAYYTQSKVVENFALLGYSTLIIIGEVIIYTYRIQMREKLRSAAGAYPEPG
jgi:hypothetical protein